MLRKYFLWPLLTTPTKTLPFGAAHSATPTRLAKHSITMKLFTINNDDDTNGIPWDMQSTTETKHTRTLGAVCFLEDEADNYACWNQCDREKCVNSWKVAGERKRRCSEARRLCWRIKTLVGSEGFGYKWRLQLEVESSVQDELFFSTWENVHDLHNEHEGWTRSYRCSFVHVDEVLTFIDTFRFEL